MTEEDQRLVARAALAGFRFSRTDSGYWTCDTHPMNKFTIGRAAALALRDAGLMSPADFDDHDSRSHTGMPQPAYSEEEIEHVLQRQVRDSA